MHFPRRVLRWRRGSDFLTELWVDQATDDGQIPNHAAGPASVDVVDPAPIQQIEKIVSLGQLLLRLLHVEHQGRGNVHRHDVGFEALGVQDHFDGLDVHNAVEIAFPPDLLLEVVRGPQQIDRVLPASLKNL
jgi:hypothetical protein